MRIATRIALESHALGAVALTLLACGRDAGRLTAPAPLPAPGTLAVVSGDNQAGVYGDFLAEPFTVRVTGAAGAGAAGVHVTWAVSSGQGEFGSLPRQPLARPVSQTDAES